MSEYFIKPIVKTLMLKGQEGQSIKDIKKTNTNGLVDTYTITLTDGTTSTFTVKNGEKGDTGSVSNLEIGGRNIFTGGGKEESSSYPSSGNKDLTRAFNISVPSYATKFVLSFEAKSTVDGDIIESYLFQPNTITNIESSSGQIINYHSDGKIETTLSTSWKRYWIKYTAKEANTRSVIFARLNAGKGSGTVSIRNCKLETGHVPTDWTPSLEDIEDTYATKSDVEQKNTSLSERVNALEKADTGWDNLYHNDDGYSYVIAREKNGIFYIVGSSGSTGIKIPAKTSKEVATVPNIFWPRKDIHFAVSTKGSEGSVSGTITTDGKINLYSTVETYYWGFCISYPVG